MENNISEEALATRQRAKLTRLRSIQQSKQLRPQSVVSPHIIVSQAVKRSYPNISYEEAQKVTRSLVTTPPNEKVKVGDKEVKIEDLQFKVAESIEVLNSETNSVQEYFSWFEDCAKIIRNMNDGYITDSDLMERNEWLDDSYTREAELMVCLGLYRNSSFPEAQQKYNQIYNKLVKLRQLRNAIKECTGNASDETRERIEHDIYVVDPQTAIQYLRVIQLFQQHQQYWNMSKAQLRKMHMFRGYDDDLDGEYDYFYGQYEPDYNPNVILTREKYSFMSRLRELILSGLDEDYSSSRSYGEHLREIFESINSGHESGSELQERIASLKERRHNPANGTERRIKSFLASRFRELSNNLPK